MGRGQILEGEVSKGRGNAQRGERRRGVHLIRSFGRRPRLVYDIKLRFKGSV